MKHSPHTHPFKHDFSEGRPLEGEVAGDYRFLMAAQPAVRKLNYAFRLKTSVLLSRVALWRKALKTVLSCMLTALGKCINP